MERHQACAVCGDPSVVSGLCPVCGERRAPRPGAAATPLVAGRYQLLDLLAEGAMGRVYRAMQLPLERVVAIKFIDKRRPDHDAIAPRFLVEAQAASRVRHPNVVTVLDFGTTSPEQGSAPFLVMELLGGPSLATVLARREPLAIDTVLDLVAQLLDALAAVHAAGITHRDVKPDNVLLEPGPGGRIVAKLIDFGVARVGEDQALTPLGAQVGTAAYMSPEAAEGGESGAAADLYAIGLILYELLTGQRPHDGGAGEILHTGIGDFVSRHGRAPAPDPRVVAPSRQISAAVARVCLRALDPDKSRRFSSAEELARALAAAAKAKVGRGAASAHDELLESLEHELSHSLGAVGLLHGSDGVGRSTVLSRLVERFAVRGRVARCIPAPPPPREQVGLSALARAVFVLSGDSNDASVPSIAPEVRAGLAQLMSLDEVSADNDSLRAALLWALGRARERSPGGRLVVLFDDVDLWDASSRKVLLDLVAEGPRAGIGLGLAMREPPFVPGARMLAVPALDIDEASRELDRRGIGPLPLSLGPEILPLELELLARWAPLGGPEDVCATLFSLVESRIAALTAKERETLRAIAVLGSAAIPAVTQAARLPGGAERALLPLERAGLVDVRGGELRVSHAIVARAAIASTSADRLAAIHAQAALIAEASAAPPEIRAWHELRGAPTSGSLLLADRVARLREARGDVEGALAVLDAAAEAALRLAPIDDLAAAAHDSFAPRIERLRSSLPPPPPRALASGTRPLMEARSLP